MNNQPQRGQVNLSAIQQGQIVAVVADSSTRDRERQVSRFTGREICFTPSCRDGNNVNVGMKQAIFEIAKGLGQAIARSEAQRDRKGPKLVS